MSLPENDEDRPFAVSWCDRGLWRRRALIQRYLGMPVLRDIVGVRHTGAIRIGWGLKKSGLRARRIGSDTNSPVWLLEDGFLRSRRLGHLDPPLSIVVDDIGMYYDHSRPSRLEHLISRSLSANEEEDGNSIIRFWRKARVSKYNFQPEYSGDLPDKYILVIDQTKNDNSIRYGGASAHSFQLMLNMALNENPNFDVFVKTHPDVLSGRRSGYLGADVVRLSPRIHLIAESVHPVRLIEHATTVYTVTSQVGFEALLWGKRVRTFGMPFYAGWGLTDDEAKSPSRRSLASLTQLAHAALLEYACYDTQGINSDAGVSSDIFGALSSLFRVSRVKT